MLPCGDGHSPLVAKSAQKTKVTLFRFDAPLSKRQAALTAEINRLRVTLFPETKTTEYAYPSDVVRPLGDNDDHDDEGKGDRDDLPAELLDL